MPCSAKVIGIRPQGRVSSKRTSMALIRIICLGVIFCALARSSKAETVEQLLNKCMVSQTRKTKPSPEPGIEGLVSIFFLLTWFF